MRLGSEVLDSASPPSTLGSGLDFLFLFSDFGRLGSWGLELDSCDSCDPCDPKLVTVETETVVETVVETETEIVEIVEDTGARLLTLRNILEIVGCWCRSVSIAPRTPNFLFATASDVEEVEEGL
mgnify:FL=1